MRYRLAIFDFDGTLADSFPFFVRVFNQLAECHGFSRIEPAQIPAFRHHSARQMMRHVGLPAWKLPFVARSFISLMGQNAADVALFPAVDAVLQHLARAGVTLAIVSSNSHENVARILGPANFGLMSQYECGMSIFGKTARIRKVLARSGIPAAEAIYIGDQITDLEAARAAAVAFGAVSWGYGAIESLRRGDPEMEFAAVPDIQRIV